MAQSLTRLARRRGRLPALVAALAIALYLLVKSALGLVLSFFTGSALYSQQLTDGDFGLSYPALDLSELVVPALHQVLPFVVGVFIGLWLIAPLADELTLRFVLTRGALAAAAGAVLVILVGIVVALVYAVARVDQFGEPRPSSQLFDGPGFVQNLVLALSSGVGMFVVEIVAVLFASVLLWLWLREHPRDYSVSGLIDEL